MPEFSAKSMAKLSTVHEELQLLFMQVVVHMDCTIIEGYRDQRTQNEYYAIKKSKLLWPESKHNTSPSLAVDVAPYLPGKGVSWDSKQCYLLAGFVKAKAAELGIKIRWGGDWDSDNDLSDQTFNDLVHYELIEE